MHIRAARQNELSLLQDIERAAGQCFRDIGMQEIADDGPLPLGELARYQLEGLAWVAFNDAGTPVAYLIADRVDGNLHIEQVSVHPDSSRRGVGRSLLDHLADQASTEGTSALTLTTFTEVPWNAPYYARCGFQLLDDSGLTPGLRQIREREAAHGLDQWPRSCMRRTLGRREAATENIHLTADPRRSGTAEPGPMDIPRLDFGHPVSTGEIHQAMIDAVELRYPTEGVSGAGRPDGS